MLRVVLLTVALCGLIGVRASMYIAIPVWTPMWWVWLLATCGVAGCIGWVAHQEFGRRR